ncbi:GrpB family protein [Lysinibacillus odysseyi]|uniref:Glutamate-rich protein GrpB n=1 Tax=Lysinibacillus odysseyi 34hs-1 = NBRC 100172 TaxID=1220589 RepID=A0A0A3IBL0_9BACI|nr:GrpB family protein [Lysinibacillus odysseyi]KGR82124.1 hypothetical protein CD32_22810 [Lysinibacillus odysseyi 34hs-1 = NBRC 100172]
MRKTNITKWTAQWNEDYYKEKLLLETIFEEELIDLFHIGSTSIQAIGYAKPIIDILMVVRNIDKIDLYNEEMSVLGYYAKGENDISGRRYFTKGGDNRTHHLHVFQVENEHIDIHLNFKAYLKQHPDEARKYGEHKLQLAERFFEDHHKYQQAKQQYTDELVRKAMDWVRHMKAIQIEIR